MSYIQCWTSIGSPWGVTPYTDPYGEVLPERDGFFGILENLVHKGGGFFGIFEFFSQKEGWDFRPASGGG